MADRTVELGNSAVDTAKPPEDPGQVPVWRKREIRAVHRFASDRFGPHQPFQAVDPGHVDAQAALPGDAGELGRLRAKLPLGGAAQEQHVEALPRDAPAFDAVLGGEG
jgi:hypothetical protein